MDEEFANEFQIVRMDEDQNLVFGWSSVAVDADGNEIIDKQGDVIKPQVLEPAVYKFVLYSRVANKEHQGDVCGQLVESLVVTPEKLDAMGLVNASAPQVGHWVGFKVDPEIFALVKSRELEMFSIEGKGIREPLAA